MLESHRSSGKAGLNAQIYAEASEWLVHFRSGDADGDVVARQRLDEWLRRSPEHVRAYLEVSALWEDMASHDAGGKIDAQAHIARALAEPSVIALEARGAGTPRVQLDSQPDNQPIGQPTNHRPRAVSSRRWVVAAGVAAVAMAATLGWSQLRPPTYETQIGEQRSIVLDDGSSIELNARSRVRVRFNDTARSVELLQGQALFNVHKDPARPFIVASGTVRVRAVGTQFDVNRKQTATTVTVIEGRVGVNSAAVPPPASVEPGAGAKVTEVFLDAGQQVTLTAKALAVPRKNADIAAATAWTQRRLIFDSAPLSEVAEEFNRYNKRPIVIRDRALDSFGVIGVFSSADPAALVKFLRAQPEIEVIETRSEILIARK